MTFYQRYCDGDRQAVWDQLYTLKDLVNEDRYLSDARAVAAETMKRARHNVEKVLPKLDELGYEFLAPRHAAPSNHQVVATERFGKIEYQYQVFTPPPARIREDLARVEDAMGTLPLSLYAWYEHVGEVYWVGDHPRLCSYRREIQLDGVWQRVFADPLVIQPLMAGLSEYQDREEPFLFPVSLDQDFKHGISGGGWDGIEIPNESADAICTITGDRFVDYLRLSFKWGGFPGWRNYRNRPESELAYLAEGLLPI